MPARMRRSSRAPRRKTTWATHQSREVFAAANDLHTINLLDQYQAAGGSLAGITAGRTLLRVSVTTLPANGDVFDLGVIRGQDSDVGTNIVGAPSPSAKLYEDWAWLVRYTASASGGGPLYFDHGANNEQLDIRARRRLPELQMSWNLAIHVGQGMTMDIYARTLVLLP
jgi:hypothetical protein